jgi:hypothetical protein
MLLVLMLMLVLGRLEAQEREMKGRKDDQMYLAQSKQSAEAREGRKHRRWRKKLVLRR